MDAKLFQRVKVQELRAELQASADKRDKNFAKRKLALKKIVRHAGAQLASL